MSMRYLSARAFSVSRPIRRVTPICVRATPRPDEAMISRLFGPKSGTLGFDQMFHSPEKKHEFFELINSAGVLDVTFDIGHPVRVHFRNEPHLEMNSVVLRPEHIQTLWNSLRHTGHDRGVMDGSSNRYSAIRGFDGDVTGVTMRISRDLDVHDLLSDNLKTYLAMGNSTIIFAPPGGGKTTLLRAITKYLSDYAVKRVVVVDESGELDVECSARRMCVHPETTHSREMGHAIRNHSPHVLVVDELVTAQDVENVLSATNRGVQVIATAHASSLVNMVDNPVLRPLFGGVQTAAVSDGRVATNGGKFVSARKFQPAFSGAYSVEDEMLYVNLATSVDSIYKSR
jgi:stage III sporulation protein SpoIIIAA